MLTDGLFFNIAKTESNRICNSGISIKNGITINLWIYSYKRQQVTTGTYRYTTI